QLEKPNTYIPELLAELRAGTTAEPVPVMLDGSTFAVHGETRTFWVKLWHTNGSEFTKIERAQIISCIPSTRGVQVVVDGYDDEEFDEQEEDDEGDDFEKDEDIVEGPHEHGIIAARPLSSAVRLCLTVWVHLLALR